MKRTNFDLIYKKNSNPDDIRLKDEREFSRHKDDPIKIFLIAISYGATFECACGLAYLNPKEVKEWLAAAEQDGASNNLYEFLLRYKHAESIFEQNALNALWTQIDNGNANIAGWLLERRKASAYSQKQEIKASDGQIIIKNDVPLAIEDKSDK